MLSDYRHFYRTDESAIKDTWARFMAAGANVCPQGAVALDAVIQARSAGIIAAPDTVVSISTASALKFSEAGVDYHLSKPTPEHANPYRVVTGDVSSLEKSL